MKPTITRQGSMRLLVKETVFQKNYIYEWVVAPDGDTWEITTIGGTSYSGNASLFIIK